MFAGHILFIIFGWPKRTKEYGAAIATYCPHCDNDARHELIKARRWFSLFFIPVVPLSSANYYLTCHICAISRPVSKTSASRLREFEPVTDRFLRGRISTREYNRELDKLARAVPELQAGSSHQPVHDTRSQNRKRELSDPGSLQRDLTVLHSIGEKEAQQLRDAGFDSVEEIAVASTTNLARVDNLNERLAQRLQELARDEIDDLQHAQARVQQDRRRRV